MIETIEFYVVQTRPKGTEGAWIDRDALDEDEAFQVRDYLNSNGDDVEARVVRRWK